MGTLILSAGFIAVIAFSIYSLFGLLKSSAPYENAVAKAKDHAAVQEAIGTPIEAGWLVTGNISLENSAGDADLSIPISGPEGKATIYVVGEKSAGEWTFSTLLVEIHRTEQKIDLLEEGADGSP